MANIIVSYLIQGLLHLYEATFDEKWVQWAYDLQQKQNELFYDKEKGGFYNISQDDKSIPIRIKDGNVKAIGYCDKDGC